MPPSSYRTKRFRIAWRSIRSLNPGERGSMATLQTKTAPVSAAPMQRVHVMSNQPLLRQYRVGDLNVPNRIARAPLTRMRAQPQDQEPTTLQAEYYAQRASAGLIITEATAISPEGFGWADTPGLWTKEQVRGWRRVTDAVHTAAGRIIAQLWHTGANSHTELHDGTQPVSASNVDPVQISVTPTGRKPTVTPRPLTKPEIQATVADFARAGRNAMEAGFDVSRSSPTIFILFPSF